MPSASLNRRLITLRLHQVRQEVQRENELFNHGLVSVQDFVKVHHHHKFILDELCKNQEKHFLLGKLEQMDHQEFRKCFLLIAISLLLACMGATPTYELITPYIEYISGNVEKQTGLTRRQLNIINKAINFILIWLIISLTVMKGNTYYSRGLKWWRFTRKRRYYLDASRARWSSKEYTTKSPIEKIYLKNVPIWSISTEGRIQSVRERERKDTISLSPASLSGNLIFDPCEAGENQCYEYQTWPAQGTLDCMVDQALNQLVLLGLVGVYVKLLNYDIFKLYQTQDFAQDLYPLFGPLLDPWLACATYVFWTSVTMLSTSLITGVVTGRAGYTRADYLRLQLVILNKKCVLVSDFAGLLFWLTFSTFTKHYVYPATISAIVFAIFLGVLSVTRKCGKLDKQCLLELCVSMILRFFTLFTIHNIYHRLFPTQSYTWYTQPKFNLFGFLVLFWIVKYVCTL
ncbi:uncharacterized protein LOC118437117 isoform X2 [Folsomia candida]|uniref:uncharacterized protein LOC118437117 isoform X2 n=1 Tax=Folsomia candida TaxID=158441 RepID=UPI0016054417|nr:uncharacterized protein LOC118437117 isoform X2 [Folsomia candida]